VRLSAIVRRPVLSRVADHVSAAGHRLRILAAVFGLAAALAGCKADPLAAHPRPAPEFSGTGTWFNSPPLSMAGLRGKVVLVEFWTYACINCLHVTPKLKRWHTRYGAQGLVIVGVHTPELDEERIPSNVENAIERLGIAYPVVLDNDYRTWNAYRNQYWPALYLVDRQGNVVYRHYGEGDYDVTEREIRRLLASH
jgi:thiol-disulfide isomerase/thioredoxin